MELYTPEWELLMTHAHDFLVLVFGPCRDLQTIRRSLRVDDQRMIAGGLKGIVESLEDLFAIVGNLGCLAVHEPLGLDNFSAEGITDRLVAKTYTQRRDFITQLADNFDRDTGVFRAA